MMVAFPTDKTPINCADAKAPDPRRLIRRSGESVAEITATAASMLMIGIALQEQAW
jgi:hypothetical protein